MHRRQTAFFKPVRRIDKRREKDPLLVDKKERLRHDLLESSYQAPPAPTPHPQDVRQTTLK
jgi:hypothetical protein